MAQSNEIYMDTDSADEHDEQDDSDLQPDINSDGDSGDSSGESAESLDAALIGLSRRPGVSQTVNARGGTRKGRGRVGARGSG